MSHPKTEGRPDVEADRTSIALESDVRRLKELGRRLAEFDKRRTAQLPTEDVHWTPALGGDLHDHGCSGEADRGPH